MAHLVAWDHQGRYDSFFGPMMKYTEQDPQFTGFHPLFGQNPH